MITSESVEAAMQKIAGLGPAVASLDAVVQAKSSVGAALMITYGLVRIAEFDPTYLHLERQPR